MLRVSRARHADVGFGQQQHIGIFQFRMRSQNLDLTLILNAAFEIPRHDAVARLRGRRRLRVIAGFRTFENGPNLRLDRLVHRVVEQLGGRAVAGQRGKPRHQIFADDAVNRLGRGRRRLFRIERSCGLIHGFCSSSIEPCFRAVIFFGSGRRTVLLCGALPIYASYITVASRKCWHFRPSLGPRSFCIHGLAFRVTIRGMCFSNPCGGGSREL